MPDGARRPRRTVCGPCRAAAALLLLAALLPAWATPAAAQTDGLDHVDSLARAGRVANARSALRTWLATPAGRHAEGQVRAHALLLRATLAPDFAAAESDLLGIVLGYPYAPQAPEALLRLGQGLVASGQDARAAGYLKRLVSDYPTSPRLALGYLWLARAERADHHADAACHAARSGLGLHPRPDLAGLLGAERDRACAAGASRHGPAAGHGSPAAARSPAARTAPAPGRAAAAPGRAAAAPSRAAATRPEARTDRAGHYAVQLGAFRAASGAHVLAARARRAGFEPRIVRIGNGTLLRVRVGRFASAHSAAAALARLRAAGLHGAVVDDVSREVAGH